MPNICIWEITYMQCCNQSIRQQLELLGIDIRKYAKPENKLQLAMFSTPGTVNTFYVLGVNDEWVIIDLACGTLSAQTTMQSDCIENAVRAYVTRPDIAARYDGTDFIIMPDTHGYAQIVRNPQCARRHPRSHDTLPLPDA